MAYGNISIISVAPHRAMLVKLDFPTETDDKILGKRILLVSGPLKLIVVTQTDA